MELTVEINFSAAHHLSEDQGRCHRTHGHNYKLFVTVEGPLPEPDGMVVDFHEVDRIVEEEVLTALDDTDLNDLLPCPTAERIVEWIFARLDGTLPGLKQLTLYETPRYHVVLRRDA